MPIYAYRCEGCGFQKDALQKLSDPPLTDCPQCGEPKFVKQLTAAGFALKGSGWYVTDFRNPQSAKPPADKKAGETAGTKESAPASAAASAAASSSASASAASAASTAPTAASTKKSEKTASAA